MRVRAVGLVLSFVLVTGAAAVNAQPALASAQSLNLKVLVISTGTPAQDLGLDLIDDVLREVGVPFDVLDSSMTTLTAGMLSDGFGHGYYNGIIVTESQLTLPSGGFGLTADEWSILHGYERDMNVREAVISGFPALNPSLGLDYGMTDIVVGATSVSPANGDWVSPAGGPEWFEYVNTANPLPIIDFAFASRPLVLYAGEPSDSVTAPQVQPLLVLEQDADKSFVSVLRYPDGREVLLSTVTNAWYLVHSQVLAYEFLDFATRGLFIGSRHTYLTAHIDDLFIEDSLWDPVSNTTPGSAEYRMTGDDLKIAVTKQTALRAAHPSANGFTLDFVFNGIGTELGAAAVDVSVTAVADTFVEQKNPANNKGSDKDLKVESKSGKDQSALFRFDWGATPRNPLSKANLTIWSDSDKGLNIEVCRVTQSWTEPAATWSSATGGVSWTGGAGPAYDAGSCLPFVLKHKQYTSMDITDLALEWTADGTPNFGLLVRTTDTTQEAKLKSREESSDKQPKLVMSFAAVPADGLTTAAINEGKAFRYISHTLTHRDMDVSAAPTYADVRYEIEQNQVIWDSLGLPGRADPSAAAVPGASAVLASTADTWVDQKKPSDNQATDKDLKVKAESGKAKAALVSFTLGTVPTNPVSSASLALYTDSSKGVIGDVCRVTEAWTETGATWNQRQNGLAWTGGAGPTYDATSCVTFKMADKATVSVDVSVIVASWAAGTPNNGFVIRTADTAEDVKVKSREEKEVSKRPTLSITYGSIAAPVDPVLVTGDHSGLRDDLGTDTDPTDDLPYPGAKNDVFLQAATDAGIRYLASDSSQLNQNVASYVPGFPILLLPRYPTAVFYNVTTPEALTDEYNYIFHERFIAMGEDPCVIPGAICVPRTYSEILSAEADTALRHILSYKDWPHFFHQSNLHRYSGDSTLMFDWLDAVTARYESLFALPLRNPAYHEIAKVTEQRVTAATAGVTGVLDVGTGIVALVANSPATVAVTGLSGGEIYGGQSIKTVIVSTTPGTYVVDLHNS